MLVIIRLNSFNRPKSYYFGLLPIKKPFIALGIEIRTLPAAGVFAGIYAKRILVPKLEDYEDHARVAANIGAPPFMGAPIEWDIPGAEQNWKDRDPHTKCRLNQFAGLRLPGWDRGPRCEHPLPDPLHTRPPRCA